MIERAETNEQIAGTWAVIHELRPHVEQADYLATVRRMGAEGYCLATATDEAGTVRAVAGYRVFEMLYCGRILYVDDLVTAEAARSEGHGKALVEWLREEARALGCRQLHLDSGSWRAGAHRFYFREGFHILGYHFVTDV